ncbi:MAG: YdcF family protein [Thermoleophilaceae bacterium]|nr:YdcF family protein [Thermoleophilaceae bacterium]
MKLSLDIRRLALLGSALFVLIVLIVGSINLYIMVDAGGESTAEVKQLPKAQAAIVLGALVEPDGRLSQMLGDRVQRAVELWRAGKVDRIIVSGDHGQWTYDEPDAMRKELQRKGVPAHVIFTDHAGFNTWASMVRAHKVFGVNNVIVITQGFHMPRALYLARRAGLEVHGLTADLHPYGNQGLKSDVREIPARMKAFAQAATGSAVLLGPAISIRGDGRTTWGPQRTH